MKGKTFRKVIAGIASLAMTMSAFAGLSISASATTNVIVDTITYDATGAKPMFTGVARFATSIADGPAAPNTTKCEYITGSGSTNGYGHYLPLTDAQAQNKIVNFEFDLYMGARICNLSLSAGGSRAATTAGRALTFSYNANDNKIKIGNSTTFGNVTTVADKGKWLHIVADVNNVTKSTELKIYDMVASGDYSAQTPIYSADVPFSDSTLEAVRGFDFFAPTAVGLYLDNIKISTTDIEEILYKVTYSVDSNTSEEFVNEGATVQNVPNSDKTGYIFKGWNKDSDTATVYSTADIQAMTITTETTFTAVYEKDTSYIEPITSVSFTTYPKGNMLVAGPDTDTAADNNIVVTAIGELGTDITANPDSRVTDYKVEYEVKGFNWKSNEKAPTADSAEWPYCDSYGRLLTQGNTANFQVRDNGFNFYGQIIATVTYNGKTLTVSKPLVYLGDTSANTSANQLLPRGGYYEDFDAYSPDMVGYHAATSSDNRSATDVITDNWATYGGNTRTLDIMQDDNGDRYMRLNVTGTNSSAFAGNRIDAVTNQQVVFSQKVRFHTANTNILLKTDNPVTWGENATTFTLTYNNSKLTLNGSEICGAVNDVWYNIIITSDVTSGKCYAEVYDENGSLLGASDIVGFTNAGSTNPTYYLFRTPDRAKGMVDFDKVKITRAVVDDTTVDIKATADTIAIPDAGKDAVEESITVSANTSDGLPAIGKAEWSIADETISGVTITPSADDSHSAIIKVESGATAGDLPISVTIGGAVATKTVTLSSSQDSVKFTESNSSISIPLKDVDTVVNYKAIVINGDGQEIAGKDITYSLYDSNNINPISAPQGTTFENGILTVTKNAKASTLYVRATSTNSDGDAISKAVKVVIHGLNFDFGAGLEDDLVDGYTAVTPTTVYSEKAGYGIVGQATAAGTADILNATTDYLSGSYTFKADVEKGKSYTVDITYSGTLTSAYVNDELTGYTLGSNDSITTVSYTVPAIEDYIDLIIKDGSIATVTITQNADKEERVLPHVFSIGDSTIAAREESSKGTSWAYGFSSAERIADFNRIATFSNNGAASRNLVSYYTEGKLKSVLNQIQPGDYVMIGCMGTNGMGKYFETDLNYYIDACETMGAKVILYSYTPHGAVGAYAGGYDSTTHIFDSYRRDGYDVIVRRVAEERAASDPNYAGFVEIGKNADAIFNAYVADYDKNGYDSADEAAQAIISCFPDHNHYYNGNLVRNLMLNGYGETEGIVDQLINLLTATPKITCDQIIATYENGVVTGVTINRGVEVEDATMTVVTDNGVTTKTMYWTTVEAMTIAK